MDLTSLLKGVLMIGDTKECTMSNTRVIVKRVCILVEDMRQFTLLTPKTNPVCGGGGGCHESFNNSPLLVLQLIENKYSLSKEDVNE